jgi:hypothetical protein
MPQLQAAVQATRPGSVSDPISISSGPDEVIVLVMPLGQPRVPGFEEVHAEMNQRALLEALDRARKEWLKELRRSAYIDVRL